MSLDDPAELQTNGLSTFPVLQINSLSGIFDIVSSTRVGRWSIVDQGLKVDDVVWRDYY